MTEVAEIQTPEPEDVTLMRVAKLEARCEALEKSNRFLADSFRDLVELVRKSESELTRKIMRAFGGVFHQLSDQLVATADFVPAASGYHFEEVVEGTHPAIVISRIGDSYNFSTSMDPKTVQNEDTDILVQAVHTQQLLKDGETKWFRVSYGDEVVANGNAPANSTESQASA